MSEDLKDRVEELKHITFGDQRPLLLPQSLSAFRQEVNEFLILHGNGSALKMTPIHYWKIEVQIFVNAINKLNQFMPTKGDFLTLDKNNMYYINHYRHNTIVGFMPLNQIFFSEFVKYLPDPHWTI